MLICEMEANWSGVFSTRVWLILRMVWVCFTIIFIFYCIFLTSISSHPLSVILDPATYSGPCETFSENIERMKGVSCFPKNLYQCLTEM